MSGRFIGEKRRPRIIGHRRNERQPMRKVARSFDAIELLRLAFDGQPKLSFSQEAVAQISRAGNWHASVIHDAKQGLAAG